MLDDTPVDFIGFELEIGELISSVGVNLCLLTPVVVEIKICRCFHIYVTLHAAEDALGALKTATMMTSTMHHRFRYRPQ